MSGKLRLNRTSSLENFPQNGYISLFHQEGLMRGEWQYTCIEFIARILEHIALASGRIENSAIHRIIC